MAFSPQFLDEIRQRLSLANVIGRRVKLTKRGEGILAKLSSVHREELRRIGPEFRALLETIAVN